MKILFHIALLLFALEARAQGSMSQPNHGGSGRSNPTANEILLGGGTSPFVSLGYGTLGQVLVSGGSPNPPTWSSLSGVTSVGLSLPNIFTVSNSPVTSSGTLTAVLASQNQNLFFGSPDGSGGSPGFRSLVSADIPSLDAGKIATGTFADARIASSAAWNAKEPAISSGTTSQYWRGDKSWQTLNATSVGLGNLSNNAQLKASFNLSDVADAQSSLDNILPSQTGHAGSFLETNGTHTSWASVAGSGTVTSVDATGSHGITTSGGPVTTSGTIALDISTNGIALDRLATMATAHLLGRNTAGTGTMESLSAATAKSLLAISSSDVSGLGALAVLSSVDLSGSQAIGTLAAARLGTFSGDVTTAGGSYATTIANLAVTNGKIANGTIDLAAKVTGVLPEANGGTNQSTYTTGDIPYAPSANTLSKLGIGSANQVLTVSGGVPSWQAATGSNPKVFSNTSVASGDTIANTNSQTAFTESYTIPANSLASGNVIRVKLWGWYSTALVTPTIVMRIKLGSTVVLQSPTVTLVTGISGGWWGEASLSFFTVGASAACDAQGYEEFSTAATTGLSVHIVNLATKTIDATIDEALTVTVLWSAASASNVIVLRQMNIELLK